MINGSSADLKIVIAASQSVVARGANEPTTDFEVLARLMNASLLGNDLSSSRLLACKLQAYTSLDFTQAVQILREYPQADVYISMSERVGLPLGMLLAQKKCRPKHLMIAHRLNSRVKHVLRFITSWQKGIDKIVALCSTQKKYAEAILPGCTSFVMGGTVDESFYTPSECEDDDYILSVGSESRDYGTLIQAAVAANQKVKILTSSPWSRHAVSRKCEVSGVVEFLPRVSYEELRDLYRRCKFVILPLHNVDYVAGHNGLLEAWCHNKAVVVSSSRGIIDYIVHESNSYSVPPEDVEALVAAIEAIKSDSTLRARLAAGGRQCVEDYGNLTSYASALSDEIRGLL